MKQIDSALASAAAAIDKEIAKIPVPTTRKNGKGKDAPNPDYERLDAMRIQVGRMRRQLNPPPKAKATKASVLEARNAGIVKANRTIKQRLAKTGSTEAPKG